MTFIRLMTRSATVLCGLLLLAAPAVSSDSKLSSRQKAMIPIAAFTAEGNIAQLEQALHQGLTQGLTVNEIKEILVQSYAYAGFPRALNGINTFSRVLDSRKQQGLRADMGKEATPVPADFDANGYGHEVRNSLTGRDMRNSPAGYATLVPVIDEFLVQHLFADIFYRDVLSHHDRELVTISLLAVLPGTEAQLKSHLGICLRIGYSPAQLLEFAEVLKQQVSMTSASQVLTVLQPAAEKVIATAKSVVAPKTSEAAQVTVVRDTTVSVGEADKFTGTAKVSARFNSPVKGHYSGALVEFAAGARTAWHRHPQGQTLIVISGEGWVQQEGKAAELIKAGDVVNIPPDTKHWHGATATTAMSHIAIATPEQNQTVTWLELVPTSPSR